MKMVKSLLLGSAAGLVAISGAMAADLPAKAKPVHGVTVSSQFEGSSLIISGYIPMGVAIADTKMATVGYRSG
jgi:hypothetical protein